MNNIVLVWFDYDAFGNIINQTGSVISNFRYKGYYYDTDIELYYLKTRFYNPVLLRFITPDSIEYLDSSSIIGLNLYAYCGYDPVNMVDEEGNLCFFACLAIGALVGAIVGTLISTGTSMYQDYQDDKFINGSIGGSVYAKNILGGAIIGAANGFATAMGGVAGLASLGMSISGYSMSFRASAALALGVSGLAYVGEYSIQQIENNDWNFKDACLAGAKGLWKETISLD